MQKGIGVRFFLFFILLFLFTSSNFISPIFQKETFLPAQKTKNISINTNNEIGLVEKKQSLQEKEQILLLYYKKAIYSIYITMFARSPLLNYNDFGSTRVPHHAPLHPSSFFTFGLSYHGSCLLQVATVPYLVYHSHFRGRI